jgi:hypothetical protein
MTEYRDFARARNAPVPRFHETTQSTPFEQRRMGAAHQGTLMGCAHPAALRDTVGFMEAMY